MQNLLAGDQIMAPEAFWCLFADQVILNNHGGFVKKVAVMT